MNKIDKNDEPKIRERLIEPVDPVELQNVPDTKPPQRERKPRKDKGKSRGKRGKIEDQDFDIPFKILIIGLTKAIAASTKKPHIESTDEEATNIEIGFNKWRAERVPQLEKFIPELYLAVPVLAYLIRVIIEDKTPVKTTVVKTEQKVITDVEADEYKPDLPIDKGTGKVAIH